MVGQGMRESEIQLAGMRVLIIDDHVMVLEALKFYLEELNSQISVTTARTIAETLARDSEVAGFDVIMLDFRMPGMSGFDGFEAITAHYPGVPVVILSGVIDPDEIWRVLRAGAAGVIPKNLSAQGMLNALELVLSGEKFLPSMILETEERPHPGAQGIGDKPPHDLSPRQHEVLTLLVQGLPNKKIAESLGIQEVTVKLHISKIFKKLGATNRIEAVRIALQTGVYE